jgi:two-component system, OmpR family, phosphate regulon sensor histidine kinase PhoR
MKMPRSGWTIILMTSSIILLLVLQLLWLRSAYKDELSAFSRETNNLFRGTIIALQDSLILKNILPITAADSLQGRNFPEGSRIEVWNTKVVRDSMLAKVPFEPARPRLKVRDSISQIEIYVSSSADGDSLKQVLRPIVGEFRRNRQPGNFVFRLGTDTLSVTTIQRSYSDTLVKSGIHIPPLVKKMNRYEWEPLEADTRAFHTEPFFLPHSPVYIAHFGNINPALLAKISPQIMFSLVLTILTVSAFLLMYKSIRSQQRLMALKNDLISNITHELKTPVATVSVALEALKNFKALDNPQLTQEYLAIAQNELNRLTLMTDKILKTAVFEENGIHLKKESVDLEEIIGQVIASLKLVFEKHRATVEFQKDGSDFIITGHAEHLTNVIFNLLDNAIKYSRPGCNIMLRLKHEDNRIRLTIEDTGLGIPYEYQQKVFEKFFRVPTGDVHDAKGYGLGLSYVASVVKAHLGEIELKSEPGKGSAFVITLPS